MAFLLRLLFAISSGAIVLVTLPAATKGDEKVRFIEFTDPIYGGQIRQIFNPAGDEHNLYHYRCVFNADMSRLLGIQTPAGSTDYRVTLYDADGKVLKQLFTQKEYDWTLVWDKHDPRFFYTRHGAMVFRYDVDVGQAKPLRTFERPSIAGPTGLSLNQAGDRLLVRMTDNTVRTYRLPELDDERVCPIEVPAERYANWDKLRFTGYKDYFALEFSDKQSPQRRQPNPPFIRIYDGMTGKLFHTLEGIGVGHHDFSPSGQLAYVEGFNQRRNLELHVVNLDGTDDRIVFTAPRDKLRYVRNFHITWPTGVDDWFLLSFFPQTGRLPQSYQPYLDELIQVFVDGRSRVLARTGTSCAANFWTQPQQAPSADGSRVLFHTNGTCTVGQLQYQPSGTIDQCILYLKD